ncbi:MAG: tetratricopeptide repeat protein, partial [Myxococcota bacterium]
LPFYPYDRFYTVYGSSMIKRILFAFCLFASSACHVRHSDGLRSGFSGPESATLPLYKSRFTDTKIFVEATLNGDKRCLFLLDTGSSLTVLSQTIADELGLVAQRKPGELVGIGGTTPWYGGNLNKLRIGPYSVSNLPVAIGVQGVPDNVGSVPLAGILGNDVLGQFQVAIDYPMNVVELARPDTMSLPDHAVPLFFNGQHALTRTTLTARSPSGQTVEQPALLEIDTGARGILLFGGTEGKLATVSTEGVEPLAGVGTDSALPLTGLLRTTRRVPIVRFPVGGTIIEKAQTAVWIDYSTPHRRHAAGMPGLLGHQALKDHRVLIDYPGKRFALTASTSSAPANDVVDWYLKSYRKDHDPMTRIRLLLMLDRPEEARRRLEALAKQPTKHPDAVVLLARTKRASGDIEGAQELLSTVTIRDLVDHGEINAWVNSHWLNGDLAGSLAQSNLAIQLDPKSADAWLSRADSLLAAGRTAESRVAMAEVVHLSQNPDAHLLRRGFVSMLDGDVDGALTHLRKLLNLNPSLGYAQWLYTSVTDDVVREELVASDINRAQERLHPGDEPLDFLAAAWNSLGDTERSSQLMKRGLARDCERAPAERSKQNCVAWYQAMGFHELPEARKLIEQALDSEPNRPEFMDTMAVVLEAQGDLDAARSMAWQAALHSPDDVYLFMQALRLGQPGHP